MDELLHHENNMAGIGPQLRIQPPGLNGQLTRGRLRLQEGEHSIDFGLLGRTRQGAKEQLLENFEREYIGQVLKRCDGNISRAARESGLHRKSIERLVKKYALDARAIKLGAG
jgi:DNA-binding NtrC family response regulator